jgi:hypothetical protein
MIVALASTGEGARASSRRPWERHRREEHGSSSVRSNIEEVLENWEVHHAIREVIANALDEQLLSSTKEIEIAKDHSGRWHVRDFGRGLRIEHFTLKEDKEKLSSDLPIIGKFGVGLKDALATFHRRGVQVTIQSAHGTFTLKQVSKHGFDNIITLHAEYDDRPTAVVGTDFILAGVSDADMDRAKSLFLRFSSEEVLDTTPYGAIIGRAPEMAKVYILGVLASEEPNFLFSYNITSLTEAMKKRLNRERLNVGRTTYTDRIKAILRSAEASQVRDELVSQLGRGAFGDQRDEMQWIEISQLALNLMHQRTKVAFVTEEELQTRPDLVDHARGDGLRVVVISEQQKQKAEAQAAAGGPELRTLQVYAREFDESFQYRFVEPANLTSQERVVFALTSRILGLVGIVAPRAPEVRISDTMRITSTDTEGCWDHSLRAVVVKRDCLESISRYAGTLLHETGHATTGISDVSREFEKLLTRYLGLASAKALRE